MTTSNKDPLQIPEPLFVQIYNRVVQIVEIQDSSVETCMGYVFNILIFFGACQVLSYFYQFYMVLFRKFIRQIIRSSLYSTYGKKGSYETWAVVTGGSDGIGFAMAKQLAQKGFNILIIGRNEKKIEDKIADIKIEIIDKEFEIEYIIADFGKLDKIEQYQTLIADVIKSKGYDVGVLCLNAGMIWKVRNFEEYPDEQVEQMNNVNVGHVIYLLKVMLPLLNNRK